ncbi:MAG: hypothetical protein ACXAD7_20925 [Candidatus Kariarchaeaceae archaeon]
MKIKRILNVLFFASILLLIPSFTVEDTIDIFPESKFARYYNLRSPSISLDTEIISFIFLNISYVDPISNDMSSVFNDVGFQNTVKIDIEKPGIYKIELLSAEVGKINIRGTGGIYPIIIIVFVIITIIRFAVIVNDYFLFYVV